MRKSWKQLFPIIVFSLFFTAISNAGVQVGSKAPDFTANAYFPAKNSFGKITLSELTKKGKWVILFFYPADFTFAWPTELAAVAAKYNDFKKAGAEVLAISTDKIFSHKIWHDISPRVKKVTYPMIEDPNGKISKMYGVYNKSGVSYRAVFIIDPDMIIQTITIHNIPIGRNINEIYRELMAAKYSRAHPDEGVPANWKPGEKGVPTGIKYVGKF